MFSIGRIPVLKFNQLTWCALCLIAGWASAANAQVVKKSEVPTPPEVAPQPKAESKSSAEPRTIAVPLSTAKRASRAVDTRWVAPPGYVTDRQLVMRLTKFQEAAHGPWDENFNWNDVLEKAHAGILAAPEDTLVIPMPIGSSGNEPRIPFGASPPPLRSLKAVAEEIIADLPPAGRNAWLRLVSDRANAIWRLGSHQQNRQPGCSHAGRLPGDRSAGKSAPRPESSDGGDSSVSSTAEIRERSRESRAVSFNPYRRRLEQPWASRSGTPLSLRVVEVVAQAS
jgi:hypothetical protein